MTCVHCVPVVLQCFGQSRAVLRVDARTAQLHILQASRKVTHIHFYCAEPQIFCLLNKGAGLLLVKLKVLYHVIPVISCAVVGEVVDLRREDTEGKEAAV